MDGRLFERSGGAGNNRRPTSLADLARDSLTSLADLSRRPLGCSILCESFNSLRINLAQTTSAGTPVPDRVGHPIPDTTGVGHSRAGYLEVWIKPCRSRVMKSKR